MTQARIARLIDIVRIITVSFLLISLGGHPEESDQVLADDDSVEVELKTGVVKRVVDGDTIQYCPKLEESCTIAELIEVDLWGLDAPEITPIIQFHGLQAKEYLEETVLNETVVLEVMDTVDEKKFVKVLIVNHPHSNLNPHLLMEGKAWATVDEESNAEEYELAEEHARERHLGLWREVEPVAPWIWRARQEEENESE